MERSFFYRLRHWETWHYLAKYIPIMPVWLWYCIRARSFWFFTSSNPTLTFGGFEGESKREMLDQLPITSYPKTIDISPNDPLQQVMQMVSDAGLHFPIAAKPDVGMMGLLFRKIESPAKLAIYHKAIPVQYILQEYIDYPMEVSVFYYRIPGQKKGTITGFLKKEFMQVTGDGDSTLWELINAYPRVRFRLDEMRAKHESHLNMRLKMGEQYCLSDALNLSRGGKLVSLEGEKDALLLQLFDDLSHYTGTFYYGRYDIKCSSVSELKQGKNFSILEYNGCGAEPHHIYGNGNTLLQAYAIVLHHWKMLYRISKINRQSGIPGWDFKRGWIFLRDAKKHFKRLRQLDTALEI